jgi:hypothetical protein
MESPKQLLKVVRTIHLALLSGALLFFVVAGVIAQREGLNSELNSLYLIVLGVVSVGAISAGGVVFRVLCKQAQGQAPLRERLAKYQAALLVRWATFEAPCLFAGVLMFIEHSLIYGGIAWSSWFSLPSPIPACHD